MIMTIHRVIETACEKIFPFQAALGIGGNLLTLLVLLSRPMRSRTNTMLAFAAISDILFLIAMVPNNLARRKAWVFEDCPGYDRKENLSIPQCHTAFADLYISNKSFITFCLNWFSGSSTWLMVAVSFDRLWAIKCPLSARKLGFSIREYAVIPTIFIFNAAITMYHNFTFAVQESKDGQRQKMVAVQNSTTFVFFTLLNAFCQIIIPMTLLIVFNVFLLFYLRNRRQFLESAGAVRDSRKSSDETPPLLESRRKITVTSVVSRNGSNNSQHFTRQLNKAERHVTITVAAIVSAYVLTHLPSTALTTFAYVFHLNDYLDSKSWYTWLVLAASIVVTGKVANFWLFCMSSRYFRAQMRQKLCCCSCLRMFFRIRKDSTAQRTRSLPLNQIGDSASNLPPAL